MRTQFSIQDHTVKYSVSHQFCMVLNREVLGSNGTMFSSSFAFSHDGKTVNIVNLYRIVEIIFDD